MNQKDNKEFSQDKLELLAQLMASEGIETAPSTLTGKRKQAGDIPLSFAQEWVWRRCQEQPSSPFFNTTVAFELEGTLNLPALLQSLEEILRRHQAWRTTFPLLNGVPRQKVNENPRPVITRYDLSEIPDREKDNKALQLVKQFSRQVFNLEASPPLRAALITMQEKRYILLMVAHHIICDGWSSGLFAGELVALYPAFCAGEPSPLPDLPVQYPDYILWEREHLDVQTQGNLMEYWNRQLSGLTNEPTLPLDKTPPKVLNFEGESFPLALPEDLSGSLQLAARQNSVSLFTVLLSAFKILLFYYSGSEDIVVGSPVANRTRLETEKMLGCFVNILALRTPLSRNITVKELLRRVQETCLGAFAHQELPFVKLVEAGRDKAVWRYHPFFEARFEFTNTPTRTKLELPGLKLRHLEFDPGTVRYPLNLILEERESGTGGWLQYSTELFSRSFINQMSKNYLSLLYQMSKKPESPIADLLSCLG